MVACRLLNSIQPLNLPERRKQDGSSEPGVLQQPHTAFPVYVMLPLDSVWLAEREGHSVSLFSP